MKQGESLVGCSTEATPGKSMFHGWQILLLGLIILVLALAADVGRLFVRV